MNFISESEVTTEYKPEALVRWFEDKYQSITQYEDEKKALRMREGLYKRFIEEIYPLKIMAELEFSGRDNIRIKWVNGNQNYDALIFDRTLSTTTKLEITNAVDEADYYRR